MSSPFFWRTALSPSLAALLLYGGGKSHMLRTALLALDEMAQGRLALFPSLPLDLLLCAYEGDPENSTLAGQILHMAPKLGGLSSRQRALLTAVSQGQCPPSLLQWQKGLAAWQEGQWSEALPHLQKAGQDWLTPLEKAGQCLWALGEREGALHLWRSVLQRRPWHTRLLLTLHDHWRGLDEPASPPGPTAVLFYSWNKADHLHAALQSLQNSLQDVALVVCLDNGSTDSTPQVLRHWQEQWGQRFLPVTLPVNVGAAAARNWLAALPEVRRLPFAAYVDDDALLPPLWLRHLGRAVQEYPQASVWGCRVADAHKPWQTQAGPLHLHPQYQALPNENFLPLQADMAEALSAEVAFSPLLAEAQPFVLGGQRAEDPDCHDLAFLRPCASVTGCCHLFRTEALAAEGFALPFSPSQYDDAERDLRMLFKGQTACYTGFCTVGHAKNTGKSSLSAAAYGNGLGNRYKLHGLFDQAAIHSMVLREHDALWEDWERKLAWLEQNTELC